MLNHCNPPTVNNIKCHICGVQTHPTSILDNLFDLKEPPSAPPTTSPDEVVEADEADRKCMCCEDDVDATFFCVECSEWLCDQCTQAHKRVKVPINFLSEINDHKSE